jgi:hypothetical protein
MSSNVVDMSIKADDCKYRDVGVMLDFVKQECAERGIKKVIVILLEESGESEQISARYAGINRKDTIYMCHEHEKQFL